MSYQDENWLYEWDKQTADQQTADQERQQREEKRKHWKLFTRSQWISKNRKVCCGDAECSRSFVASNGRVMYLFAIEQTRELTEEERQRYVAEDKYRSA